MAELLTELRNIANQPYRIGAPTCDAIDHAVTEIEKLRSALAWYQERVQSICKPEASADYIEAIFTELMLDAGKRATDALPARSVIATQEEP